MANRLVRDMRIDALRGLMLAGMMIAHSYSQLAVFTARSIGFADVAAGFVFLAGMAAGMGYAQTSQRFHGAVNRRIWRRAIQLWATHVALVGVLIGVRLLGLKGIEESSTWNTMLADPPGVALLKYASLLYQTQFLDILPMYCLFLLVTPFVVRQLRQGRGAWVFFVCAVIWFAVQFGYGFEWAGSTISVGLVTPRNGSFDPLAWQALFIAGLSLVVRRESPLSGRSTVRTILLLLAVALAVVLFLLNRVYVWWPLPTLRPLLPTALIDFSRPILRWEHFAQLADKEVLAPVCLLNFAVIAYIVWRVADRWPALFHWRWLALIGRNSLPVFVWHVPVIFAAHIFQRELAAQGLVFHAMYALIVVASLTIPALTAERYAQRCKPANPKAAAMEATS